MKIYCYDLEVMVSYSGRVELRVYSTSVQVVLESKILWMNGVKGDVTRSAL